MDFQFGWGDWASLNVCFCFDNKDVYENFFAILNLARNIRLAEAAKQDNTRRKKGGVAWWEGLPHTHPQRRQKKKSSLSPLPCPHTHQRKD